MASAVAPHPVAVNCYVDARHRKAQRAGGTPARRVGVHQQQTEAGKLGELGRELVALQPQVPKSSHGSELGVGIIPVCRSVAVEREVRELAQHRQARRDRPCQPVVISKSGSNSAGTGPEKLLWRRMSDWSCVSGDQPGGNRAGQARSTPVPNPEGWAAVKKIMSGLFFMY
jgi:hypothetical protein